MKKILLLTIALAAIFVGNINAQVTPCTPNGTYTSPGIYPSDTLQDMQVGVATNQVVDFVFPEDTVIFGFTVPFDSFVVSNITNIPGNLQWQCNNNHPVCTYVTTPGQLTRGCVTIYDAATAPNPAYPGYDSIIVTGVAWVTLPFGGAQPISTDISVFYRVGTGTSVADGLFGSLDLKITPNPVAFRSVASFNLDAAANVKLTVVDVLGKEVAEISNGMMGAGSHELKIDAGQFEAGAYFLKININNGEFVQSKKFMAIR